MDEQIAKKINEFFTKYKLQQYKKGEILIRADDAPSGIFYLQEGNVRQYEITKEGVEQTLNIYKPISFFPMMWAINNTPNKYYFEAIGTVKVWRAPKDDVIDFIKQNPDVMYNLLSRLYSGMAGLLTHIGYLMSGGAYAKLVVELFILAKRFGKETNGKVDFRITEKEIASQAGLSRETVSRQLQHLKRHGIVSFEGNLLTIHNMQHLEEQLE